MNNDSSAWPTALNRFDDDAVRAAFITAVPFPHFVFDNFLDAEFAKRVAEAFSTYDEARKIGREFRKSRENRKIGISDASKFAPAVSELNEAISQTCFTSWLSNISNIQNLCADDKLIGGGMHITAPGGRLDVHVDFNFRKDIKKFRRLNLLIYLNTNWRAEWGGQLELWDKDVTQCQISVEPAFNRCVIFETSEISYHGVRPVSQKSETLRKSFAAYYYAKDPSKNWSGEFFDTRFKPRPNELPGILESVARWFGRDGSGK